MDLDPDNEEMEDVNLYEKMERHWSMVFEDNKGRLDEKKAILRAKRWDACMKNKILQIKCGYYVEVSVYYGKKMVWGLVDNHFVEEKK